MKNPIIEEVRNARAAFAAEHDYDLQRIHEWAKAAHEKREEKKQRPGRKKGDASASQAPNRQTRPASKR